MIEQNKNQREKFREDGIYTRDEFVEICRELAADPDLSGEVVSYLLDWIKWANAGFPNALIRFEPANGRTYPTRVVEISINQETGEVSEGGRGGFDLED
jgi:hypothetical protein